jgi:hypothetical protein
MKKKEVGVLADNMAMAIDVAAGLLHCATRFATGFIPPPALPPHHKTEIRCAHNRFVFCLQMKRKTAKLHQERESGWFCDKN